MFNLGRTLLTVGVMAMFFSGSIGWAADFSLHGDLNNRFMLYTNQASFFQGPAADVNPTKANVLDEDGIEESWGEIKYRLWTEGATSDDAIKGVFGVEIGGVRFGREGSGKGRGGAYSGDGVNIETRWAYTDFQLPVIDRKARVRIGLLPFTLNSFLWKETAMGVQYRSQVGETDYTLAWVRGREVFSDNPNDDLFEDVDALSARFNLRPAEQINLGIFGIWQHSNNNSGGPDDRFLTARTWLLKAFGEVKFDIVSLGMDGSLTTPTGFGNFFVNWDAIYQTGNVDRAAFADTNLKDYDLNAWLAHVDVGVNIYRTRLTYTTWYASGDDDPTDDDFEGFLSTDVDRSDSVIIFESGYTDAYFTERPYLLDKGLIFNKLAVDHRATDKLTLGGAMIYLMTAEDIILANGSKEDTVGLEFDAYIGYDLYENLRLALNTGYLFADDALDYFETVEQQDGRADVNVFCSTARIRYTF